MDAEWRAALQELQRHVEASGAETRRHFDVVAEGLRGEMRLVAERVTGLSQSVDRLEVSLREEILRAQRELGAMLRLSCAELDRTIQSLEARVSEPGRQDAGLESRRHRLEASH